MSKNILLIGGGGHCKSVIDCLLSQNEYDEIGIIDLNSRVGTSIMGIPFVGDDSQLSKHFNDGYRYAFITVGSIGNPVLRIKLFNLIRELGFTIPTIVDSSSSVSTCAELEEGVFVGKQAIVNSGTLIGKGAIINSGAIIEHDCNIGAFAHIAPGAVLGGTVTVGESTHIGMNASVKQGVQIGSNSTIGMGSVVIKDLASNVTAYGNPCREV